MTHERGRGDAPGSSAHYWTLALQGLAVLLTLVFLVGLSLMRANDDAGAGQGASPEDEADRLRARFEERDARQVGELTEVARWKAVLRETAARMGDPPSGETYTNVARGSLDAAVDALQARC